MTDHRSLITKETQNMAAINLKQATPRFTYRTRRRLVGYLFILPTLLFFLSFIAFPFFRALSISLTTWAGYDEPRFVGLQNFNNLLKDRIFWISLKNTFLFTGATTLLQTVIPLLVAVL